MFDDFDDFDGFALKAYMEYATEGYWKTGTGVTVRIKDMETSHIKNCILFLERRGGFKEKIQEFQRELKARDVNFVSLGTHATCEHRVPVLLSSIKSPVKGVKLFYKDQPVEQGDLFFKWQEVKDVHGHNKPHPKRKKGGKKAGPSRNK